LPVCAEIAKVKRHGKTRFISRKGTSFGEKEQLPCAGKKKPFSTSYNRRVFLKKKKDI